MLLLVACRPTYSTRPLPTNTAQIPSTPAVTAIATQTLAVGPSVTPTLSDQNARVLALPRWARYSFPGGILALPYDDSAKENPSKVILVNPDDGEKFFIDLMKEFYYYYWVDNEHIVFFHDGNCDTSPIYISDLNVSNGVLNLYSAETFPGEIETCCFSLEDKIVHINYDFSEGVVEYVDPSSGDVSQLTDPDDGVTDISVQLSRDNDFLAVVQFDGDFKFPETTAPVYGNTISIFNLRTRQLMLQYFEEQGILSEVSFVDYVNLAYMRRNTPCLVLILSQVKKCIHNIQNRFPDSTIILAQNSYHDARLQFFYFSKEQGGYCSYDTISGGLGCLTDRFAVFHDQFVINYSFSYYGHYRLIEYSSEGCPAPWCVNPENTYLALSNQEGELFELGSSDLYYISSLFRPLRPDPWQPWRL